MCKLVYLMEKNGEKQQDKKECKQPRELQKSNVSWMCEKGFPAPLAAFLER